MFKINKIIETWLKELFKNVNKEYINSSYNCCGAFNSKVFCIPTEILSQLVENYGSDSVVNRCTTYFQDGNLKVALDNPDKDNVTFKNIEFKNNIKHGKFEYELKYDNFLLFESIFLSEMEGIIPLLLKDIESKVVGEITKYLDSYRVDVVSSGVYKKYEFSMNEISCFLNKEKSNIMLMHPKTKEYLNKFINVTNYVFCLSESIENDLVICGQFKKFLLKFGNLKFKFIKQDKIIKMVVLYELNFDCKVKIPCVKTTKLNFDDWKENSKLSFVWFGKDLFDSHKNLEGLFKLLYESSHNIKNGCLKNLSKMCFDEIIKNSDILKRCRISHDLNCNKNNMKSFNIPVTDLFIDSLFEFSNEPFLEKFITTLVGPEAAIVDQFILKSMFDELDNVIFFNEEENFENFKNSFLNQIKNDGTIIVGWDSFKYIYLIESIYPGSLTFIKNNNPLRFNSAGYFKLFSRDCIFKDDRLNKSDMFSKVIFFGDFNLLNVNLGIEIVNILKIDRGVMVNLKVSYDLDILNNEKFLLLKFKNSRECA